MPPFPILQLNTEPYPHKKSLQRLPELERTCESRNQTLCQRAALLLDKDTGSFPLQRTLGISPAKTNEVLKSKPHLHKVGDGISHIWKAKIRM